MYEIVLIKELDLIQDVSKIAEKLPHYKITTYDSTDYKKIYTTKQDPDLIILDLAIDINTSEVFDYYLNSSVKIAVVCSDTENKNLIEMFKLGLDGYFYKNTEISEIVFSIKTIMNGQQYIHSKLGTVLLSEYKKIIDNKPSRPTGILTQQEWNVLELIAKGENNSGIAQYLFISSSTVNNHVASILKKLHVTDRTNAVIMAIKNNWLELK